MSHVMAIEVPKSVAWSDHGPATCWRFAQTASTPVWYVCYSEYDVVSFARRRLELTRSPVGLNQGDTWHALGPSTSWAPFVKVWFESRL